MRKGLVALAIFVCSGVACASSMGGLSDYSFYSPTPVLESENLLLVSGTIQGYANVPCCVPPSVFHQPIITFSGAVTGTGKGATVSPSTNVNYSYSTEFSVADANASYDVTVSEEIFWVPIRKV